MNSGYPDCTCLKETSMAILVADACGSEAWIPKSQIDDDSEVYREGGEGLLIISAWCDKRIEWEEK